MNLHSGRDELLLPFQQSHSLMEQTTDAGPEHRQGQVAGDVGNLVLKGADQIGHIARMAQQENLGIRRWLCVLLRSLRLLLRLRLRIRAPAR